ncbi:MAG: hypothetical protein V4534_02950 [Myxococcota bacterium]
MFKSGKNIVRSELFQLGSVVAIGLAAFVGTQYAGLGAGNGTLNLARADAASTVTSATGQESWIELVASGTGHCDTFNVDPQPAKGYRATPNASTLTYDFNGAQVGIACTKGIYVEEIKLKDINGFSTGSTKANLQFITDAGSAGAGGQTDGVDLVYQKSPNATRCIPNGASVIKGTSTADLVEASEIAAGQSQNLIRPFTGLGLGEANACLVNFDLRMRDNGAKVPLGGSASSRVYVQYTIQ